MFYLEENAASWQLPQEQKKKEQIESEICLKYNNSLSQNCLVLTKKVYFQDGSRFESPQNNF